MSYSWTNLEIGRLARELSALTGEPPTRAILVALQERVVRERDAAQIAERNRKRALVDGLRGALKQATPRQDGLESDEVYE